jgi:folylpolyglutamate synthase/dihydropteroate synthase
VEGETLEERIRSERAASPSTISQALSAITPSPPDSISPSIADAIDSAHAKPNPILLTGSLHFAGEALAILRGESKLLEDCAR